MNKTEILIKRIKAEYTAFTEGLAKSTASDIIERAELIAAVKKVCRYIEEHSPISESDAEYFLKLDKPLRSIAEIYEADSEINDEEFGGMIWDIIDKDLCSDYETEER